MKKRGGEPARGKRWMNPVSSSCSDAQHPHLNLNKIVNLLTGQKAVLRIRKRNRIRKAPKLLGGSGSKINISDQDSNPDPKTDPKPDPKQIIKKES
jgi:hypothetical protein